MVTKKANAPTSATALRALLKSAATDYATRKQRAKDAVVRWAWATGPLFSIVPFQAERRRGPTPRPLKSAPAKKTGSWQFGFEEDGRLRVIREHTDQRGGAYETFIDWDDASATFVRYDYDPKYKVPSSAARLFIDDDGRPIKCLFQGPQSSRGTMSETYHYKGDRIVCIRLKPPSGAERVYRLSYDGKGLLAIDEK